jgi:hypothetical protein
MQEIQGLSQCFQGSHFRGSPDREDTAAEGMPIKCYEASFIYLVRTS